MLDKFYKISSSLTYTLPTWIIANARAAVENADVKDDVKRHVRQRGISASNLMMRANRMTVEVAREIDFHTYNGVSWDPEKPKWGQKKWKSMDECSSDVERLNAV